VIGAIVGVLVVVWTRWRGQRKDEAGVVLAVVLIAIALTSSSAIESLLALRVAGETVHFEHPAEPLRILLVGRVSPRKVTDVAVEAMALLRRGGSKAVLDVVRSVFGGYEWFEERVRALIRTEGLEDSVH
jgi:glycosyltransferase involved in cell wall biosynthesis